MLALPRENRFRMKNRFVRFLGTSEQIAETEK
jgi:hypothetical protein